MIHDNCTGSELEVDGRFIAGIVCDDKFMTKEKAHLYLKKIEKEYPHIKEESSLIVVEIKGRILIEIYWGSKDDWRYGITSKKQALELAKEFIRLYCLDELPIPKLKSIRITTTSDGDTEAYNCGKLIAKLYTAKYEAEELYKDENIFGEINNDGLKSHDPKWDRSIRRGENRLRNLETYCLLLMDYMDENWGRCV